MVTRIDIESNAAIRGLWRRILFLGGVTVGFAERAFVCKDSWALYLYMQQENAVGRRKFPCLSSNVVFLAEPYQGLHIKFIFIPAYPYPATGLAARHYRFLTPYLCPIPCTGVGSTSATSAAFGLGGTFSSFINGKVSTSLML